MTSTLTELQEKGAEARRAARRLASLSTAVKDAALFATAQALLDDATAVLAANEQDCAQARGSGLPEAMLDRMMLDESRLRGIAADVRAIAALPDPVGETIEMRLLPNGLEVGRRRVPLGKRRFEPTSRSPELPSRRKRAPACPKARCR
jgi:glutamate-5-semialdehyde dehydrogenase